MFKDKEGMDAYRRHKEESSSYDKKRSALTDKMREQNFLFSKEKERLVAKYCSIQVGIEYINKPGEVFVVERIYTSFEEDGFIFHIALFNENASYTINYDEFLIKLDDGDYVLYTNQAKLTKITKFKKVVLHSSNLDSSDPFSTHTYIGFTARDKCIVFVGSENIAESLDSTNFQLIRTTNNYYILKEFDKSNNMYKHRVKVTATYSNKQDLTTDFLI